MEIFSSSVIWATRALARSRGPLVAVGGLPGALRSAVASAACADEDGRALPHSRRAAVTAPIAAFHPIAVPPVEPPARRVVDPSMEGIVATPTRPRLAPKYGHIA
jgi:hypothetical protein